MIIGLHALTFCLTPLSDVSIGEGSETRLPLSNQAMLLACRGFFQIDVWASIARKRNLMHLVVWNYLLYAFKCIFLPYADLIYALYCNHLMF